MSRKPNSHSDMNKSFLLIPSILLIAACSGAADIGKISDKAFEIASAQCKLMDGQLNENNAPRTYTPQDVFVPSALNWWCSGFYPGTLWYVYEKTGDPEIKALAEKNTVKLDDVDACKSGHDVGFQYWCSYGNGLRIAGHKDYLPTIEKAAAALVERFNPTVGCIRSWGNIDEESNFKVIIDNMMNLELLMEASRLFSCDSLAEIARIHANTTIAHHFRPDYTTFHVVDYDQKTGLPARKHTAQGFSDESAWARGQAWALYGFTMMFRETEDDVYLAQAENIARMLLKRLPEDGIPYWDFDCTAIPYTCKDASAAAIMASAFVELAAYTADRGLSKKCEKMSLTQLRTLASDEYMCKEPGKNGCFLLRHSVGNLTGGPNRGIMEVDAPLSYADYYFLEALLRWDRKSGRL